VSQRGLGSHRPHGTGAGLKMHVENLKLIFKEKSRFIII